MSELGQEPAFPVESAEYGNIGINETGMSKRFYAAIKLRVPESGEPWLDDMIRKANRREDVIAAMQGILADSQFRTDCGGSPPEIIYYAYELADELLRQEGL